VVVCIGKGRKGGEEGASAVEHGLSCHEIFPLALWLTRDSFDTPDSSEGLRRDLADTYLAQGVVAWAGRGCWCEQAAWRLGSFPR
jgi:hypothetical protein